MPRRNKGSDKKRRPKKDEIVARKRSRYLDGGKDVNPGDYDVLCKFLTEQGKIIPGRMTGATAKQQRQIKRAVRRARTMGLTL